MRVQARAVAAQPTAVERGGEVGRRELAGGVHRLHHRKVGHAPVQVAHGHGHDRCQLGVRLTRLRRRRIGRHRELGPHDGDRSVHAGVLF